MIKKTAVVLALLILVLITGCKKEEMTLRRTVYFYTEVNSSEDTWKLYDGDKELGIIPFVENGISNFKDRNEGLKIEFSKRKNKLNIKNEAGKVVVDLTLSLGRFQTVVDAPTGNTSTDVSDGQGVLLGVNP